MAKSAKYYVVWKGVKPGVYSSWKDCEEQVKGYAGAKFKAFPTKAQAEEAFANGPLKEGKIKNPASAKETKPDHIVWKSISVDAACSGNPGIMEYRGVHTDTGKEIFRMGPFAEGTNNIGEFLALVHALALLHQKGDHETTIYSDSRIAQGWVRKGKAQTKLVPSGRNKQLFGLINRAEQWLKTHKWRNPIIKWETKDWGEIPADFGRK
jgi:ribonuclease HI